MLIEKLFKDFRPQSYFAESKLDRLLDLTTSQTLKIDEKLGADVNERVDPNNTEPIPAELDDLLRLHYLATSRRALTILEFGVGKSSVVLADAISRNRSNYANAVQNKVRRASPFELHCVDNSPKWISKCQEILPDNLEEFVTFHHCDTHIGDFCGRMCTYYHGLPNVCPDLIYLDAPDQYTTSGDLRGLHIAHADRMPMAADILAFEHFLQPGTLIVVDGRTANARFLQCNFQRNWRYEYSGKFDQSFFELNETPIGKYNRQQLEFAGIELSA